MYKRTVHVLIIFSYFILSACSMFGEVSVDVAPFEIIEANGAFELRHYERLVLVSTNMPNGMDTVSRPFRRLFDYISGKNAKKEQIVMTAPVFMDQVGDTTEAMSFILPENQSLITAPSPLNPEVKLTEYVDYNVAVITYRGFLNQKTISAHKVLLENWVALRGLKIIGEAKAAGYNPPFTIPFLRRNEIFIPIEMP